VSSGSLGIFLLNLEKSAESAYDELNDFGRDQETIFGIF